MGKALLCGQHGLTFADNDVFAIIGLTNVTIEGRAQYSVTEDCTLTGPRGLIASGGDGTNTFISRVNGSAGNLTASRAGPGTFADTTHSDSLSAGDLINGRYDDTGSNSITGPIAWNVEFASGHGNFHRASAGAGIIVDTASTTRYCAINGNMTADLAATPTQVQFKVREYTSLEAFQVNVQANDRTNNTVFSVNINGVDVGTAITYGASAVGLQSVTGMGISLSPGDLVCVSCVLLTGVEDLTLLGVGVTMKSTNNGSESGYSNEAGIARTASATPDYYSFGQGTTGTEATAAVAPGFAARCTNLRCYLSANTYTVDATLRLIVNGSPVLTTTITSGGGAGWYENAVDTFDIDDNDTVSFEIVGGTSGSATIHQVWITFAEIGDDGRTGTMAAQEVGADDATAAGGVLVEGTLAATETGADDATMSGVVPITGTMDATEVGADTFAGSGLGTAEPVPEPEPEPPSQAPQIFMGGVGGVRRELSEDERQRLLKRIRKSLGMDKDPEPVAEVALAPDVSFAAIVVDALPALDRSAATLRRARARDDEEIVLLSAGLV